MSPLDKNAARSKVDFNYEITPTAAGVILVIIAVLALSSVLSQ